jgi:membrane fusion protein, multidrug efflux system
MKTFMSKPLMAFVVLSLVALGGAALYFAGTKVPAAVAPPQRVSVVAAKVKSGDVPVYLRGVGTVIAYNNVIVRSQITGQLINITFKQGQTVDKGDLLAEIDPRPYQAQVDEMEANRERDQAQLVNAKSNLDRYSKLGANGWATPQLIETQKAQLDQLQAMVKSDEALIAAAKINLSYTSLTAPIKGVTGIRQIDNGNIIHPTDPNGLVDVTQIQPISVIFTLPEASFATIQAQMAKRPLTVLAYSQDDKTQLDSGELELIDNQILQTTGTIRLRANFPNARRLLWPGQLVNARLLLETRPNGLTIPPSAVQQGPNGPYVYAIGPDDRAQQRPVTVAQISDDQALIDSGLQADETVVVDGQYGLQPGTLVNVLHGKAAQEAHLQSAVEQAIP